MRFVCISLDCLRHWKGWVNAEARLSVFKEESSATLPGRIHRQKKCKSSLTKKTRNYQASIARSTGDTTKLHSAMFPSDTKHTSTLQLDHFNFDFLGRSVPSAFQADQLILGSELLNPCCVLGHETRSYIYALRVLLVGILNAAVQARGSPLWFLGKTELRWVTSPKVPALCTAIVQPECCSYFSGS